MNMSEAQGLIAPLSLCDAGEPGGDRTHDPLIKSQVLYH